jgi:predicted dienelactone hydrolase
MRITLTKRKQICIIVLLCISLMVLGWLPVGVDSLYGKEPKGDKKLNVGYTVLDFKYQSNGKEKTLSVAVWYPTTATAKRHNYGGPTTGQVSLDALPHAQGGPYPLLVFSHGFGGSGLSAVFLNEHLAAKGWIVAAPDHNDKYSAVRIRTGHQNDFDRNGFMQYAQQIASSDANHRAEYLYRLDEMRLVLDRMLESDLFGPLIDRNRIAVGGHSLGGFTALGLCGTIPDRRDDRIKAALLLSTGAGGYLYRESELAKVRVPLMLFLGEKEKEQKRGSETMTRLSEKIYRNVNPPKYYLVIKGANHFSFNNRFTDSEGSWFLGGSEEQFEVIRRYSITFLEKYVNGKRDVIGVLERKDPLVTRYISDLLPERYSHK